MVILRGIWDEQSDALGLTVKTWNNEKSLVSVEPVARNLEAGIWVVYVGGELLKHESVVVVEGGESAVGGEDVDVVTQRVS